MRKFISTVLCVIVGVLAGAVIGLLGSIACYLMFFTLGAWVLYRMVRDFFARVWSAIFPPRRMLHISDFDEAPIVN
jgi:uncharacterized membrane protein